MAANNLRSQNGNAMLETIPLLAIFVMFVGFGLGLFGFIHTGILYSIAARAYTSEIFRNRTNLTYHRENLNAILTNKPFEGRYHFIQSDTVAAAGDKPIVATARPIAMGTMAPKLQANKDVHNNKIFSLDVRNQNVGVSPAWVMVGYGMCLNAHCGGD